MDTPNPQSRDHQGISSSTPAVPAIAGAAGVEVASRPPSSNTGGKLAEPRPGASEKSPPDEVSDGFFGAVVEYAESDLPQRYSAITDFLSCTLLLASDTKALSAFFHSLIAVLGCKFSPVIDRQRGLNGYQRSFQLGDSSGMFAIGGNAGTAFLTLPGEACAVVDSTVGWEPVIEFLTGFPNAHITRWDGAVDDFAGEHPVDHAVKLYLSGAFNAGGRKPSCCQSGNWLEPDGTGRTLYLGKRKNGKLLRVYEKGMQLGRAWHPWVRWEVELHNVDRVIPWEVLIEPGKYVVGSYPKALGWVQEEMTRIKTVKREMEISYEYLVECAAVGYGKLVNVMRAVEGSDDAVLKLLQRPGRPNRLQHSAVDSISDCLAGRTNDDA